MKRWFDELKDFGITKKDYVISDNDLSKRFRKKAQEKDIIWSLINKALIYNINDYIKQHSIYRLMGNFIKNEEKNDPNQYFKLSTKCLLLKYKSEGIKKVRFIASLGERTCKNCTKLNGKIFVV